MITSHRGNFCSVLSRPCTVLSSGRCDWFSQQLAKEPGSSPLRKDTGIQRNDVTIPIHWGQGRWEPRCVWLLSPTFCGTLTASLKGDGRLLVSWAHWCWVASSTYHTWPMYSMRLALKGAGDRTSPTGSSRTSATPVLPASLATSVVSTYSFWRTVTHSSRVSHIEGFLQINEWKWDQRPRTYCDTLTLPCADKLFHSEWSFQIAFRC